MEHRQNFGKKKVGEKTFLYGTEKSISYQIVSQSYYKTNGEDYIIVKDVEECELVLDELTTTHITIKCLTKTLIKTNNVKIDDYYDEIMLDRGACVEFIFLENYWYILSSDGLKFE